MKKFFLLIAALIPAALVSAQSMYIYQGNVATMVNANLTGDITYSNTALTVRGLQFPLATVDSITFSNNNVQIDSVTVKYTGTTAKVFVPIDILPYLTITANDAHVSIVSSQMDGNEIKYALTGSSTDGSFYQEGDYKCTLCLNNITLNNTKGGAIDLQNGKRIEVDVPTGTVNSFTDCTAGTQKSCFYVKGHAEFKGGGTINLIGNTAHAYKSNEYTEFKTSFGTMNITSSANDAMHISQYFKMNGGVVNISGAAGDGIQVDTTSDKTDEFNGQMFLNGGTVSITLNGDGAGGLKCDSLFTCTGGTYNITMNGKNSDGVTTYAADISSATSSPLFTIYANGGYLTVDGDKKKSSCFKTATNMYFHDGTINAYPNINLKAKGIKVDGNYYYTSKAKTNVVPDVAGQMIVIAQ